MSRATLMPKVVCVQLSDDQGSGGRLGLALRLAARHQAHVVGLYPRRPAETPAAAIGRGASGIVLHEIREARRARGEVAQAAFEAARAAAGVAGEFHMPETDPVEACALHSRYADLLLIGHPAEDDVESWLTGDELERTLFGAGSPTLVVPSATRADHAIEAHVLIAWKSSRAAARALHDALPLLSAARRITILEVAERDEGRLQGAEVATYLARHGLSVDVRSERGDSAGAVILDTARRLDCSLVVMGAYGRSLLAERVLGGGTRHALTHAALPLFMSH